MKEKRIFRPHWFSARLFFSADGRLCHELFYFTEKYEGGSGLTKRYGETHDDLLPQGSTFLLFGIEPTCFSEGVLSA